MSQNGSIGVGATVELGELTVPMAAGDMLVGDGSANPVLLNIGASATILTEFGGTAVWAAAQWIDAGSFLHPNEVGDNVIVGAATEAAAAHRLNADGSAVFNEQAADADFRIESSGVSEMLVVNAGTDRVGIGGTFPGSRFSVINNDLDIGAEPGFSVIEAPSGITNAKTGTMAKIDSSRFISSGSLADDFITLDLQRNSINSGATLSVTGPLLNIRNQFSGGATDSSHLIELDQDVASSGTFINFVGTVGVGNPIEAVGAKTLTVTHFLKVNVTGGLTRYIEVGTIA